MPRIASLLASATEIVAALGYEDQLVLRSHECDYPATVSRLPACSTPKFATDGSSVAIDQRIKTILAEGLSVYRVDPDALRSARPDVIITQTQCAVCAVSEQDVRDALATWVGPQPKLVNLCPNSLADVWADFQRVADALDVPERGAKLVADSVHRMQQISERVANRPTRPTVATVEWIDPLMTGGNWMPELIAQAGGINLFGVAGGHSPLIAWQDIADADPDVLLVLPCGWDIARTRQEMPVLLRQPGWRDLKAVRHGRVFLLDGNQYFNRPGPRLVDSLQILADILHRNTDDPPHVDAGWQPYA